MAPSTDRTSDAQETENPWTVVATTVPSIDPIGQPPNLGDDAAIVFNLSPVVQVGTALRATCYGQTSAGGFWAADGPLGSNGTSSGNRQLAIGTFHLKAQGAIDIPGWDSGSSFSLADVQGPLPLVTTPSGPLTVGIVSDNVISGSLTILEKPAEMSLTVVGDWLFGVVAYLKDGSEGSQTVGVYGAEAGGGNEDDPPRT